MWTKQRQDQFFSPTTPLFHGTTIPPVFRLSPTLYTVADPGFVGVWTYRIFGAIFKEKRLQNYEHKIMYES